MSQYVINTLNGKLLLSSRACSVILDISNERIKIGYVPIGSEDILEAKVWDNKTNSFRKRLLYYNVFKDKVIRSTFDGELFIPDGVPPEILLMCTNRLGKSLYPYNFSRRYEAVEHFDLFYNKQQVTDIKRYKLSKYLKKLTFGLEFETSLGAIPENLCFRDGLIPLRDGSITGIEYSTVVLKRNTGLSLLHQAINTLKEYTVFNKDCSLHVHVGGFPLDKNVIFRIYRTCYNLQTEIGMLIPPYSFCTHKYKSNGKDYCKQLMYFNSFEEMYYNLVGVEFNGRLNKPHPKDLERGHKWNVNTRYFFVNFINAICYNVNKTIEFRFLRPTYNFKKILLWLYILGAIVKFGKDAIDDEITCGISLKTVLQKIYPPELSQSLLNGIQKLKIATQMQTDNGDLIGEQTVFEDRLFKGDDDW